MAFYMHFKSTRWEAFFLKKFQLGRTGVIKNWQFYIWPSTGVKSTVKVKKSYEKQKKSPKSSWNLAIFVKLKHKKSQNRRMKEPLLTSFIRWIKFSRESTIDLETSTFLKNIVKLWEFRWLCGKMLISPGYGDPVVGLNIPK